MMNVYDAGGEGRRYQLALPQKVQVYRACWVISILKEHSQSSQVYLLFGETMDTPF